MDNAALREWADSLKSIPACWPVREAIFRLLKEPVPDARPKDDKDVLVEAAAAMFRLYEQSKKTAADFDTFKRDVCSEEEKERRLARNRESQALAERDAKIEKLTEEVAHLKQVVNGWVSACTPRDARMTRIEDAAGRLARRVATLERPATPAKPVAKKKSARK